MLMAIGQTLLYEVMVFKKYVRCSAAEIILKDTVRPLMVAMIVAYLWWNIVTLNCTNTFMICILGIVGGAISIFIYMIIFCNNFVCDLFSRMMYLNRRIKK